MKFYKTICEDSNIKYFAIDDCFKSGNNFSDLIDPNLNLYWNKKNNVITSNSVDLKDIFNFYRINDLENITEVFPSKNWDRYSEFKNKIRSILFSYRKAKINVSDYKVSELVPERIIRSFFLSEINLLKDAYNFLEEKPWGKEVISFFKERAKTNVLVKMNYPVTTLDGIQKVNLAWQANFRFKSLPGSLNIFNMRKEDRHKIIPQDKDSMLYCVDFRQFEFRTYCMVHPELEVDFSNRELYEDFAERLDLDFHRAKNQIIAYGYGQKNDKLDLVLNRKAILNNVRSDFFSWRGYLVIFRPGDDDKIKIHTLIQTISQYIYLEKLEKLLDFLTRTNSKFVYPHHDMLIMSLKKDDYGITSNIRDIVEDEVYKVKEYIGPNFGKLEEIKNG